ncbi:hypothetical protein MEBOL_006223 [Melittangium boletus DSM 14713]|uniref:Recombinase family protein n=2 Tax=Melittangium boletus TaxID=83453 RepID=A0A250ILV2_9BACT|nr:recombinase family protein [Melittangium boletus]ATB32734.1 hypothetical protein MEBOL_006223 [Melittangium boletus DSM 14713]
MPKAYSYLRFSTPDQSQGDSFRRQSTAAQSYASRKGLDLDDKLTFQDLGVSAFRGKNLEDGQLGAFLTAVQVGKVEPGSYLLVESLDRLSRQAAWIALGSLTSILAHGITLVTLNDEKVYSQATMTAQPMDLMYAIMGFIRANDESAHKSFRLKDVWSQKRLKAAARKPMTAIVPNWIWLDKATGTFQEIPEKVEVIRRIFRDYLSGMGVAGIVKALNRDGVPVFSRTSRNGIQAKQWHVSYIRRTLENPAVIGTYTVHTTEHEGKKKVRRKAGDPIPNYFPAIIDEDTFQRAQAIRLDTPSALRGRNANREDVKNLFGGVVRCGLCSSTMNYISKGRNKKRRYSYLVCAKARHGAGCKYRMIPYEDVEGAFLQHGPAYLANAPTGEEHDGLDAEIQQVNTSLEVFDDELSALAEAYARTKLQTLLEQIRKMEESKREVEAKRDDLYRRAGALADPFIMKRIDELSDVIQAEPLDRRRANVLMRMVFSTITVHPLGGNMVLTYKHGGVGPLGDSLLWGWPRTEEEAAG